jgi:exopolyphosphatase / guanosine-5'-triphosphate,3'-diphosphate pyrophosphatase
VHVGDCNDAAALIGYLPRVGIGVIDIGSNTLLLLIVDDAGRRVVDLCRFGRLGQGLDATGRLSDEAIARSLEHLREFRRVLDEHGIASPTAIATQATREASNGAEFCAAAETIIRAPIGVIAGEREAELAFTAVARTFPDLAGTPYVVIDVGGASTEFIVGDGARVTSAVSVPIGAVRLTERHLKHDPPSSDEARALFADIDGRLQSLQLPTSVPIVATAGTATTMAAIALQLAVYDPDAVTGFQLAPNDVDRQLAHLLATSVAERRAIVGLEPQRADVIAAGVAIYARALRRIAAPVLITCDRGIRWGIAYERLSTDSAGAGSPSA